MYASAGRPGQVRQCPSSESEEFPMSCRALRDLSDRSNQREFQKSILEEIQDHHNQLTVALANCACVCVCV